MSGVRTTTSSSHGIGVGGAATPSSIIYENLINTPPPTSARKEFLNLWHRVISKRTEQLQKLDVNSLFTLYNAGRTSRETNEEKEKWRIILTRFPLGKPVDKNHYIDLFRYILTGNFHISLDSSKDARIRLKALEDVRKTLSGIDMAHAKFFSKELREQQQNEKHQQQPSSSVPEKDNTLPPTVSTDAVEDRNVRDSSTNDDVTSGNADSMEMFGTYSLKAKSDGGKNTNHTTSVATSAGADSNNKKSNKISNNNSKMGSSPSKEKTTAKASPEIIEIEIDDDDEDEAIDEDELVDEDDQAESSNNVDAATLRSEALKRTSEERHEEAAPVIPAPIPRAKKPLSSPIRYLEKTINFGIDSGPPIPSSSLQTRSHCALTFHCAEETPPSVTSTTLDGEGLDDIYQRLAKWEPYWKVVHDCSMLMERDQLGACYEMGFKTAPVIRKSCHLGEAPVSAVQIPVQVDKLPDSNALCEAAVSFVHGSNSRGMDGKPITWGQPHQSRNYTQGQRRLILRAIPRKFSDYYKKKKADTHCWPKGTFVQVNGTTCHIYQRKQQSHDPKLWKGLSHICDLTPMVSHPMGRYLVDICTRDFDSYMFQVAICDYLSPDCLFDKCMASQNVPGSIKKLSYQQGLDNAMTYVNKSAVVLDDSDDDGDNNLSVKEADCGNVTLTFTMLCPMSMTPIQTPVRGHNCKHMQCFDLRNFLQTNVTVSGGRWRCVVCEDFVALDDLTFDGFQKKILDCFEGQISSIRDKVQFFSDGTYRLMDENRLRYSSKKRGNNSGNDSSKRVKDDLGGKAPVNEVIEL